MKGITVAETGPDIQEMNQYDLPKHTSHRTPETYYRYGYLVDGGNPQMVYAYERYLASAVERAKKEASRVRDELRVLGAPQKVSWWTQKWTVETSENYTEAEVVEL